MTQVPPRLHVIPATGCDKALVLRRGPRNKVASLLWDRTTGDCQLGQWMNGRIYEHRSDLSPDGRHMIVFARRTDARLAWTALSRAPWLRALQFYAQEHTWHGGGAFDADGRVWLNGAQPADTPMPDGLKPADVNAFPHATDGFHLGNLYAEKMTLRGWSLRSGARYDIVMTKPIDQLWHVELTIKLGEKNRSLVSDGFTLVHNEQHIRIEKPDWEWADPFSGSLQYAANGALHSASVSSTGKLQDQRVIKDFNEMVIEPLKAPYQGVTD